jgi:hypothetical protein
MQTSGEIKNGRIDAWEKGGGAAILLLHAPWHFLYFFPLPQGQGSLRPTLLSAR